MEKRAAFGVNFAFYNLLLLKRVKDAFRMEEVRMYFIIILVATAVVCGNVLYFYGSFGVSIREAAFHVVSIMTTTGFTTSNFDFWPSLSKAVLLCLMLIGACAGSTGGGIKVSRLVLMGKTVKCEMKRLLSPRSIQRISMDGQRVEGVTLRSAVAFLLGYCILFALSVLIISNDGFTFETNFSAVAATLNNVGPGLAEVGPAFSYNSYGIVSKIVMIVDMLAGRLELLAILILLYPGTWKRH